MKSLAGTPPARLGSPDIGGSDRHVHDLEPQHAALRRDGGDLAAGRGLDHGAEDVVLGPRTGLGEGLLVGGAGDLAGRRQDGPAGVIGDLQRQRGGLALAAGCGGQGRGHGGGDGLGFEQHRAARGAVLFGDFGQFIGDQFAQPLLRAEDGFQFGDFAAQLVLLLFQLDPGVLGQLAQPQFQDVVGLDLGEVVDGHQPFAGGGGLVRGADDLDDLVDVHDGDQQALHQVQAVLLLAQPEGGAAAHHVDAVVHVDGEQLPPGPRVCGWPSTRVTLLMPKESSIGE